MSASVAVKISYSENGEKKIIILDSVEDTSINKTSSITTHPVVSGDMVADHMFREPLTLTISGEFSLNGSSGIFIDRSGARLINFQEIFEHIQDEALTCDIVKVKITGDSGTGTGTEKYTERFSLRSSMVLTGISWTERINSLGFSLSFTQALLASVEEDPEADTTDDNLPSITEPNTLSFTETLIDWDMVDAAVVQAGLDTGFIEEQFKDYMLQSAAGAAITGVAVGGLTAAALSGIAAALVTAGVVTGGAAIVAVVAAAAVAAVMIFAIGMYNAAQNVAKSKKFMVEAFKLYDDDRKNQQEVERFTNFVGSIHQQIQVLDEAISVWQIASNEEQECILTISGYSYVFTFTKNNISGAYSLKVTLNGEDDRGYMSVCSSAPTSWAECTSSNRLFRADGSGAYVYLVRLENIENTDKNDLTNYFIVASLMNPDDYNQAITSIIENAILR